jgi:Derlin-2/3
MVYIWSKANSKQLVHLFGFVSMRAGYLPFAFFFFSLMIGGTLFYELLGLLIGHVLYYFYFVVPKLPVTRGTNLLAAPRFIKYIIGVLQLDSKREILLEEGDFVEDDEFIPNLR